MSFWAGFAWGYVACLVTVALVFYVASRLAAAAAALEETERE